jgi:pyruvate formate lyase activating enzyme
MRGLVFDIQRTALHDGPGVRTTVFLKGCPLRCAWCHNPESWKGVPELSFERQACADCLACVAACPNGAQQERDVRHVLARERCRACGTCVEACDHAALSLVGRDMGVEEVMAVVGRDRAFYQRSGGGLTVSGGEPLFQAAFTRALLEAAKALGLHTCLDTCGHGNWGDLEGMLPVTDLVLFDYKVTGTARHEAMTGVDGGTIHANLGRLLASGARVALRVPLVPGVNDTDDHLDAIAALGACGALAGVEIMPYHALGRDKRRRLGRPDGPPWPTATEAQTQAWLAALAERGCSARRG